MIGTRILNYEILEKLGTGGQGDVYKAIDTRLNRPLVIKVLPHELTANENNLRRFEREAQLISSIDHPNICTVYEFNEVDGLHLMVMQLIEGRTIRQLVNGRPLELKTTLRIGIQVADALAAIHARNIIHRDIKAGNVMVTSEGLVKIIDFGLAKFIGEGSAAGFSNQAKQIEITETGSPRGTATYAAPEQARGEDVDHRADIFSTGVLLYEMLTGTWPFRGKNVLEVRSALINDEPLPIAQRRAQEIPERLQTIVSRAMAKARNARYQTSAELRDELASLLREMSSSDGETDALLERIRSSEPQHQVRSGVIRRASQWLGEFMGGEQPSPPATKDESQSGKLLHESSGELQINETLAVLPFKNLSGEPEFDFYEFALADTVITELARQGSLIVRPSAAIMKYSGCDYDPCQAGRELKAQKVLSANFLREENRLQVTVQLLNSQTCSIVWSERISTDETNIISVQDMIARRIIGGLHSSLTVAQRIQSDTRNESAFREYLRGRHEMRSLIDHALTSYDEYLRGRNVMGRFIYRALNKEQIEAAIAHFNRAIQIDPQFARAYSGLGSCYTSRLIRFVGNNEDFVAAQDAFDRALALDPYDIEAKTNKVFFHISQGKKQLARRQVAELLDTHPHDVSVQFMGSYLYRLDGDYERALSCLSRLLLLNPAERVVVSYSRARIYMYQGNYESALTELMEGEQVAPDHPLLRTFRAMCWFLEGRTREAAELLKDLLKNNPDMDGIRPHYAMCLVALGDFEGARAQLNPGVKEIAATTQDVPYWIATVYVMLGEDQEALEWFQRAINIGNENLPWFKKNPVWRRLQNDPRFLTILNSINPPPDSPFA